MNEKEQIQKAKNFSEFWKGKGYEKGQSQPFWISLLHDVYGIESPEQFISFEDKVMLDNTSFIDGNIPETHVLIEQKGINKNLRDSIKQSDGTYLTPFQQAKRYASELPYSQRPRWIVTCNFKSFLIYDMENPKGEPEEVLLENLSTEYYRLKFLVDSNNEHIKKEMDISIKAGEIVGKLYDEILPLYKNSNNESSLKSLNMLCVRLVFCLYAEDALIFGRHGMFHDYISQFDVKDLRRALIELFKVLDTKAEYRDPYIDEDLAEFPYVNGGLFEDESIEIPNLTENVRSMILAKASEDFNWSDISPTIFGAVFESTLNPETRRKGGMHYTSIENIHKVIEPLFLERLKQELYEIKEIGVLKSRLKGLQEFQEKLASLTFLDPACGSGNFLTETYISLRRLENQVIELKVEASKGLIAGQIALGNLGEIANPIKVSIGQFYGIEINDFAVTVAKTALWIAESQMMKETEDVVHINLDFLPLRSYANIVEGNALKVEWNKVISKEKLNYIMGNPPFVGKKEQQKSQKNELIDVFGKNVKGIGKLDYVTGWYKKATNMMKNTTIRAAFVSTNSITQGEQVPIFWNEMFNCNTHIDFAYQTFRWDSEASMKASVHCVIIGFSTIANKNKRQLYLNNAQVKLVDNINPYLVDAPSVLIESRRKSICGVPTISYGSMPIDDGNLILDNEGVQALIAEDSDNTKFVRKYAGGTELINNKDRWCLWLDGISPKEIQGSKFVMKRVKKTAEFRRRSNRPQTIALADKPTVFGEIRQPNSDMLVIPKVSSENRRYIPISYMKQEVIINGSALIIPDATLYHFGVLISNVHMSWMRAVAGRMKSDYQYSGTVVYNNFPWATPTKQQKEKIENTAQAILDARNKYSECSLAELYDVLTMPSELRKAHRKNDIAVMEAYGFPARSNFTESMCVAELMKKYEKLALK